MKNKILIAALFFSSFTFAQQTINNDSTKVEEIKSVTLSKKVFQKKADRFVYDVSATPAAKGSSTFDILKQTPLLSTTDDKTLTIAGKNNAIIFINGRRSTMNYDAVIQFLKNTPADNIQKIEIITVPGSEYQVESSDGIINIILKKKQTDGTNGNFRMTNTQNRYNNTSASFNINYRKGRLGINASLSGNDGIEPQYYIIRNGNQKATSTSVGDVLSPEKNIGGYINIDYQLNDKSNLALSWNNWNSFAENNTINLFNTITYLDSNNTWNNYNTLSKSDDNTKSYNNSWNLNYELKTDSLGSKLNLNAAYLKYNRSQNSVNNTINSNANKEELGLVQQIFQNVPQKIDNFSATVDYVKKYKNDFTFGLGGNVNITTTDNDTHYKTVHLLNNTESLDPNHFIYKENIYGAYLTLEKKFSDRFSGKIGSRYEITHSIGTSDNAPTIDMQKIERNYSRLLPYLSANYSLNDNNTISYSFSTRVRRPSFWELNPVKNFLTDNNYTQNNPFVKASTTYNQELTYMYKNAYFLVLNHTYFDDVITQVPLQKEIVNNGATYNKLAYIRTNFGSKQQYQASLGMQKSFFKQYWTTNLVLGVQHNINNGSLNNDPTTGELFDTYSNTRKSTSMLIKTSNTIRLDRSKTWFLGVNAFLIDKQQIELGELQALSSVDLSIKKLWNDWSFAIDVSDIFRTNIIKIKDLQMDSGNFNYVSNDMYRRGITFTASYNFGNKKVEKTRSVESAADDIKSRTR